MPLLIFVAVAIEAVLKRTLAHPPPPDESVRSIALIPSIHVAFPNSFPSGHVLRVTFLAAIVHGVPTWISGALVLLMVASRVYLAEHWLSDCIGGLALGLIAAGVGYALFGRRDDGDRAAVSRPGAQRRR